MASTVPPPPRIHQARAFRDTKASVASFTSLEAVWFRGMWTKPNWALCPEVFVPDLRPGLQTYTQLQLIKSCEGKVEPALDARLRARMCVAIAIAIPKWPDALQNERSCSVNEGHKAAQAAAQALIRSLSFPAGCSMSGGYSFTARISLTV